MAGCGLRLAGAGLGIVIHAADYDTGSFDWRHGRTLEVDWLGGEPPPVCYGYDFSGRGRDILVRWSNGRTRTIALRSRAFILAANRTAVVSISDREASGGVIAIWRR